MPLEFHPPGVELLYPLPDGEAWDPHVVHTNYFGITVPEAELGIVVYLRCMPAFPLCQGGIVVFRGMDNVDTLDAAFHDYEITMPWPDITDARLVTANGLTLEFVDPGRVIRLRYESPDGHTRLDVTGTAVTPMVARGHVMSGEEDHHGALAHGGMEQFMHYVGEVVIAGERHAIDAFDVRDRSWNQVRTERQNAVMVPPLGWTPIRLGDDVALNLVCPETHDTDPRWPAVYDIPADRVRPVSGMNYSAADDEALPIVAARRDVLAIHPQNFMPVHQRLELELENGRTLSFEGRALATADIPQWPNTNMRAAVYRWVDDAGRACHTMTLELWFDRYQRLLRARA